MLIDVTLCIRYSANSAVNIAAGPELIRIIYDQIVDHKSGPYTETPKGVRMLVGCLGIVKQAEPQRDNSLFKDKEVFHTGPDMYGVVHDGTITQAIVYVADFIRKAADDTGDSRDDAKEFRPLSAESVKGIGESIAESKCYS
jgi:hypothetical protein